MDVAGALDKSAHFLGEARAFDAITETIEVALPLASRMAGTNGDAIEIALADSGKSLRLGSGTEKTGISGIALDLLSALWGRNANQIETSGDAAAIDHWLGLIELAFVGR